MFIGLEQYALAETEVRQYLEDVIERAMNARASDIHFEPLAESFRVRFRVDGVLQFVEACGVAFYGSLVSILKILANLDIAEKRLPQDGSLSYMLGRDKLDLRISIIPSVYGESVALRLFKSREAGKSISVLGFMDEEVRKVNAAISQHEGLIVVAGATGSGKTTTLYTLLSELDVSAQKVISVEDPVEASLPGVNQVPVNTDTGMTFASSLRAILRQSPDVIMIGEIRDQETAEIAMHAASTGHLVFTSLHADSAEGVIVRLLNLGISSYLLAEYLRCIICQKLARRKCQVCKGQGDCQVCSGIGCYGRVGICSVLAIDKEIQKSIAGQHTITELSQVISISEQRTMSVIEQELIRKGIIAGI